jgi:CRISPR-associated endoribonuclease Cas6
MFTQISMTLLADGPARVSPEWAYAMYGVLCRKLEPCFADALHGSSITPISQFLQCGNVNEPIEWHVTFFGSAQEQLTHVISNIPCYELAKYGSTLNVTNMKVSPPTSEGEFCKTYLAENAPRRRLSMRFIVPTAFKSDGEYVIMPSIELIFQSLLAKWNACAAYNRLDDPEVLQDICAHTRIVNYSLRTTGFALKGVVIPAFTGSLKLSVRGPDMLAKLVNLLTAFGSFSGIGIKTALGMGGVI